MKTHAALGADILSSIQFPYPVVPIVRHHHENWDGTGYPDGLTGSQIPLGARILSVVDCYDALTSDRPYRPAMSDAQAVEILIQRRGRMYDPLVVDAFVSSLDSLKATVESDTFATLITQKSGRPTVVAHPSHTDSDRAMVLESLELLAAMAPFPPGRAAMGTARDALSLVRHIAPFDTSVLFVCDSQSLELRPLHTGRAVEPERSRDGSPFCRTLDWLGRCIPHVSMEFGRGSGHRCLISAKQSRPCFGDSVGL